MTAKNRVINSLLVFQSLGRSRSGICLTLVVVVFLASSAWAETPSKESGNEKQVIGPTAIVEEVESDLMFPARVDTGATTSSLHVEDCKIEDEASQMAENVGKKIRFRIKNHRGESEWLERKIAEICVIKTSEREEIRYKVPVTLNCLDVKKRVLVSLNDRSHMAYPILLGRNFLRGDFVVDVDLEKGVDSGKGPSDRSEQLVGKSEESASRLEKDGSPEKHGSLSEKEGKTKSQGK